MSGNISMLLQEKSAFPHLHGQTPPEESERIFKDFFAWTKESEEMKGSNTSFDLNQC